MTVISQTAFLSAYFARIGYQGPVEPSLEVLQQLHLLHPQAIPFENIAPYMGEGVPLDLEGRSWFVDVAFGSTTQTAPLEYVLDTPQTTPHGVYRIAQAGDELSVQFQCPTGWQTVYHYTLARASQIDFEIGNWYTSTYPQSVFLNSLLISRTQPGVRELMVNDTYTQRDDAGLYQRHQYTDAVAWVECLRTRLGLNLSTEEAADLFQRISQIAGPAAELLEAAGPAHSGLQHRVAHAVDKGAQLGRQVAAGGPDNPKWHDIMGVVIQNGLQTSAA